MTGRSSSASTNGSAAGVAGSGGGDALAQWDDWLATVTDRLLDLEQRAATAGSEAMRLDLAAAFVCRKAIATRTLGMRSGVTNADGPIVDDHGELVGADLSSAATLLVVVLDRVQATLAAEEASVVAVARDRASAEADAAASARLAAELGQHVRRVAESLERLAAARANPSLLTAAATELAALRAELEALAAQRRSLLARWATVPDELRLLCDREVEVRSLVATCRDKVRPLPVLAVPAASALGEPDAIEVLQAKPWPAARAIIEPYVARLDRVTAALAEVGRQHAAVLGRRDELRGLLHAFRDKAGSYRLAENAELEPAFKAAESVLWSAPCDVEQAAGLVAVYTDAVNRAIAALTGGDDRNQTDGERGADR
jgi:hypothetical protein